MQETDKLYLEKFTKLDFLAINDCGLTSMKNLPWLPGLLRLEMTHNLLDSGFEHLKYPKLMILKLRGNRVSTFETIKPLQKLYNL